MNLLRFFKGTHYVNFNSPTFKPVAIRVNSPEAKEVKYKISCVLCVKLFGLYIPLQNNKG